MINSFCIKTNNNNILNYLLSEFENINLDDVHFSNNQFKIYENIIVHYKGNQSDTFLLKVSDILSNTIVKFYEENLLKKLIYSNYFYFFDSEKIEILENALQILNENKKALQNKKSFIFSSCYEFLQKNKSLILDGFVNFRLQEYLSHLDNTVDLSVDKFLIDREYKEFITLLKLYIDSKENLSQTIHLVYLNDESILLDNTNNIIDTEDDIFNAKYLSDISFSSNDYALNTLLSLLPRKLYIHLINSVEDEFINTLKLIFDYRVYICKDCHICNIYKLPVGKNPQSPHGASSLK